MSQRIYFYAKDFMTLTGKNERTAYTFLKTLKDALGKKPEQPITIKEYADYEGISEAEIRKAINA